MLKKRKKKEKEKDKEKDKEKKKEKEKEKEKDKEMEKMKEKLKSERKSEKELRKIKPSYTLDSSKKTRANLDLKLEKTVSLSPKKVFGRKKTQKRKRYR